MVLINREKSRVGVIGECCQCKGYQLICLKIVIRIKFSTRISNPYNQPNLFIRTVQIRSFDFVIDLVHSFHFIILYNQVAEPEPWFMLLLMYYHFIRNIKQLTRAGYTCCGKKW